MMGLELLEYGFMQRAFAAGVAVAIICPAIGVFLLPRRLSLIADTLAHVALAGVAVGLLLGVSPILGALAVALAGAVGIERLRAGGILHGDAALALFLAAGFAVAVVLISLARGFNADLFAILFGSIMTVSPLDVWLIAVLAAAVVFLVWLCYPRLLAVTLSEELARTSGVPVAALNLLLTVLTALTVVVAMRMVGVLLVSGMIVIPTLTGFAIGRSFRGALLAAIGSALLAVVIGLVAAYHLGLAAGGAIVLAALLLFVAASLTRAWTRGRGGARRGTVGLALLAPVLLATPAGAHPHVFIEHTVTVQFGPAGPQALRFAWTFDEMNSALILYSFDADGDGTLSPREVRAIEQKHFGNLERHQYFVQVRVNGRAVPVTIRDFRARVPRSRVIYEFSVPLTGAPAAGRLEVSVDDPTFYTAFIGEGAEVIRVEGSPGWRADCRVERDDSGARPDVFACAYRFGS
jgi:zinc transport system permease protein